MTGRQWTMLTTTLDGFEQSSLYEDYQRGERWTESEWGQLRSAIRQLQAHEVPPPLPPKELNPIAFVSGHRLETIIASLSRVLRWEHNEHDLVVLRAVLSELTTGTEKARGV